MYASTQSTVIAKWIIPYGEAAFKNGSDRMRSHNPSFRHQTRVSTLSRQG
jgi:hypothetical protein